VQRQVVCEVRNKLKIIYRRPFQVQDVKPEHAAMRRTFVKQIQDWRRAGIIKNLIFSDEGRFYRGPDSFWVRVRRGAWNDSATVTPQKFPLGVVMVFGAIGLGLKRQITRCANGVSPAEYEGRVSSRGLPNRQTNYWARRTGTSCKPARLPRCAGDEVVASAMHEHAG
jgi:hypothetical protein